MAKRRKNDFRRWERLKKQLRELHGQRVRVGVLASGHGNDRAGNPESGWGSFTIAGVMAVHEYGNKHVPARRPIRTTFERFRGELVKFQTKLSHAIITKGTAVKRALPLLGEWGAAQIKKTIKSGPHLTPALAKSTVKRKKSRRPLVDTGRLANSITYEVVPK